MISIVILTYNESINIERCIRSVSFSDDILVVDSGSTDQTCEIAKNLGARIIHRKFDNFANQRNYALDHGHLRHEWVLHIDADEVVSPALRDEMIALASGQQKFQGYRVPSRLMLIDQWLKHSGMYPTYQVRFGSRDKLRFLMVGHGQRESLETDQIGTLTGDLIHYNFSHGISEWLCKHARYARDEAQTALSSGQSYKWISLLHAQNPVERRRVLKGLTQTMPLRPLARFGYVYFLRFGFLDGVGGLRYAILMAVYQWAIDMNMSELRCLRKENETGQG